MNRWRVGEDRGSKETDGCPLTAYREGKGTKEAQVQVKRYGSHKQTSHRRVYKMVARAFN
jgi:hypothetical protein